MSPLETNINRQRLPIAHYSRKELHLRRRQESWFPLSKKAGQNKFSTLMTYFEENTKHFLLQVKFTLSKISATHNHKYEQKIHPK